MQSHPVSGAWLHCKYYVDVINRASIIDETCPCVSASERVLSLLIAKSVDRVTGAMLTASMSDDVDVVHILQLWIQVLNGRASCEHNMSPHVISMTSKRLWSGPETQQASRRIANQMQDSNSSHRFPSRRWFHCG